MEAVLRAEHLGKRYRRHWALTDCSLEIAPGHVTGLVGRNGAGKTTLLSLAAGMRKPSEGKIEVCGGVPGQGARQRAKVGYVAQDTPTYTGLTVEEHLRLGAHLNPNWDDAAAKARIGRLGLDPKRRAGQLSGGQRAQLALTMGLAKRPELLILDEPVASLDPLARREFLQLLMEAVAEQEISIILSSHVVSDLERVCDHVVLLVDSQVRLAGDVDEVRASHHRLIGPKRDVRRLPESQHVVTESHTDRQTTLVVRTDEPIHDPAWTVTPLGLEDLILAYLDPGRPQPTGPNTTGPTLEALK